MQEQAQFVVGWGTLSLINAGLAQAKRGRVARGPVPWPTSSPVSWQKASGSVRTCQPMLFGGMVMHKSGRVSVSVWRADWGGLRGGRLGQRRLRGLVGTGVSG